MIGANDSAPVEVLRTAHEVIARRPDMYFDGGVPTLRGLLARLAHDVRARPAACVGTGWSGRYGLVFADYDWLVYPSSSLAELFTRFLPCPRRTRNGFRAEVLVGFAAEGLICGGIEGLPFSMNLSPTEAPARLLARAGRSARWLLWRMGTSGLDAARPPGYSRRP